MKGGKAMSKSAIDFNHLRTYTGGDVSVEREILGMFVHQAEMWLRLLDDPSDDSAWQDVVHTIKGSSRGVGAFQVAILCEKAETLIGEASLEERGHVFNEIKSAISDVFACIDDYMSGTNVA